MKNARRALSRLDPESRALLDLTLRRGLDDDDIANVLRETEEEVKGRRNAALDQLAQELRLETQEERDELFATLQDLPAEYFRG
jgi:DNA-directed RNA polymerase specialized sigma24 family protein